MASTITIKFTNPPKDGKADGLEVHLSEAAKSVDWAREGTQFPNVMGIATSRVRFNGVPVMAGSIAKYVFGTAGSFGYRCRLHNGMTGTVDVSVSAGDSAVVQIGNNFFNPTPATVKPGGYVRWVSIVTTAHTVSRP